MAERFLQDAQEIVLRPTQPETPSQTPQERLNALEADPNTDQTTVTLIQFGRSNQLTPKMTDHMLANQKESSMYLTGTSQEIERLKLIDQIAGHFGRPIDDVTHRVVDAVTLYKTYGGSLEYLSKGKGIAHVTEAANALVQIEETPSNLTAEQQQSIDSQYI